MHDPTARSPEKKLSVPSAKEALTLSLSRHKGEEKGLRPRWESNSYSPVIWFVAYSLNLLS